MLIEAMQTVPTKYVLSVVFGILLGFFMGVMTAVAAYLHYKKQGDAKRGERSVVSVLSGLFAFAAILYIFIMRTPDSTIVMILVAGALGQPLGALTIEKVKGKVDEKNG